MGRSYDVVSAADFTGTEGLADWRVEGPQAVTTFRTGDFATGLRLVNEIGRLAEAADHHPDLLLRYPEVEVRLGTHDTGTLTTADVDLALAITTAAGDLGVAGPRD